jgi:cob(I)alamin adenosyltransferase
MKAHNKTGDYELLPYLEEQEYQKTISELKATELLMNLIRILTTRDQDMDTHYKKILIEVQDRLFTVTILATPQRRK